MRIGGEKYECNYIWFLFSILALMLGIGYLFIFLRSQYKTWKTLLSVTALWSRLIRFLVYKHAGSGYAFIGLVGAGYLMGSLGVVAANSYADCGTYLWVAIAKKGTQVSLQTGSADSYRNSVQIARRPV
jgi:hypothetical protein